MSRQWEKADDQDKAMSAYRSGEFIGLAYEYEITPLPKPPFADNALLLVMIRCKAKDEGQPPVVQKFSLTAEGAMKLANELRRGGRSSRSL